ncbi:helix-turn-helix domain-containing protein [Aquimarina rubra]|uniref:Helix-turn-helix domain-containing protein n=1 Tax=Aquimarina rubra TaxID=1920033 RepID=A0ABW5LG15_9FLAO
MKQFLSIGFLMIAIFLNKSVLASEIQSIIPDSLTTKSPQEIISYLKYSKQKDSDVYEIALSALSKDDLILAQQYYTVALFFYETEQYERALYYLNKSITLVKELNDSKFLCTLYLKSANAYLKDWQNQKSLDYYNKALFIAQKKGSIKHELIANSGLAIILRRMGQLDKALKVCKNSLVLTEKSSDNNTANHVRLLTIISEIYLDQTKYDSVLHYADIGLAISKPLDYSIGSIDLLTKKGIVALNNKEQTKALQYFYEAKEIIDQKGIKQKKSILNLNYFLANYFYQEKQYNKAISYLNNSVSILEEKDARNIRVLETYLLLANCYTEIGQTKESMFWFQKLITLQDEFQDAKNKTITKLYNQDINKLENQIEALKNEEMKEERYKEYIFVILLSVCFVLVFFIFKYYQKQKNNTARFDQLIEKINSLQSKEKNILQPVVINDEKVKAVLDGLDKLENQEYFLHTDCDLRSMSKKVKTNTTYLSKIIKTHKANSFNDYINDLRIEYALKRLKNDKKFRSFSVKSIALEIGYKTDNSFTKHFKSKTGLNPSYYIRKINSQDNDS